MTPTPVDLFAEEITYNGLDISRIDQIGSCTAGLIRNRYSYDADHRLTQVDNTLFNPYETKDAFSASYSYDPAGNLISLKRNGWRDAVQDYVLIDDISYAYSGNNSVLTSVQEQTGLPEGLAASSHYSYDLNGNLIGDTGKGITQIDYNLLNLPVKVTGQGGGILEFEYTFGGEKIRKNNELEREYVGGLEYKNNVLELIHFPNGRIDKTGTADTFQYYLTDHLGNIVVLFQDTDGDGVIALEEETNGAMDEVIQRNYYYSFGLRVDSPDFQIGDEPKNRYLYNGKELNEELELNWLDYGFRWYDPAVGRFPSVDPLADAAPAWSPYRYGFCNPISHIDPDGRLETDFYNLKGKKIGTDGIANNQKRTVLTKSTSRIIKKVMKNSGKFTDETKYDDIIRTHTEEELLAMDRVYSDTEIDNLHEEGFVGGLDNNKNVVITPMEPGPKSTSTAIAGIDPKSAELSHIGQGALIEYESHSHPYYTVKTKNGTRTGGLAEPSGLKSKNSGDIQYQEGLEAKYGVRYSIIQGYSSDGGTQMLGFFNSKGVIKTIEFEKYKNITRKINKQK